MVRQLRWHKIRRRRKARAGPEGETSFPYGVKKIPLVASIFGEPEELAEMAGILNGFDLAGLEINASCPNTETCILQGTAR
ncbi:hypothetical protein KKA09_03090 [Patescibacteria group bacterium]|nr:hypothetical protein [Patescibacteria group bacterium]